MEPPDEVVHVATPSMEHPARSEVVVLAHVGQDDLFQPNLARPPSVGSSTGPSSRATSLVWLAVWVVLITCTRRFHAGHAAGAARPACGGRPAHRRCRRTARSRDEASRITWSHTRSRSCSRWEERITERPPSATASVSEARNSRRARGSRAATGSSSSRTSGAWPEPAPVRPGPAALPRVWPPAGRGGSAAGPAGPGPRRRPTPVEVGTQPEVVLGGQAAVERHVLGQVADAGQEALVLRRRPRRGRRASPVVGAASPTSSRSRVVLPAPFGSDQCGDPPLGHAASVQSWRAHWVPYRLPKSEVPMAEESSTGAHAIRSACRIWSDPPQHRLDGLVVEALGPGRVDPCAERSGQAGLDVGRRALRTTGHEGADPLAALHQSFVLELPVGLHHRIGVDGHLGHHLLHRGQLVPHAPGSPCAGPA